MDQRITVLLTDQPLSLDAAFRAVCLPGCGGTALFVGTTRSPSEGREVELLEYEAYDRLARRELEGVVLVGEPSVIVAASAPHRGEAFSGCRELIDELKRTVPIWKKERWAGGGRWVGVPDELQEVPSGRA